MNACEHDITFGGRTVAQRRVGDILLAEAHYEPRLRVAVHEHGNPYVGFVLAGACREHAGEHADARTCDFKASNMVVKAAGDRHWNETGDAGARYLIVEVGAQRDVHGLFDTSRLLESGLLWSLALRLRQELHERDTASSLAIEALVLELLAGLVRENAPPSTQGSPAWLLRARDLLHDCARAPLSIADVAKVAGVHPSHLARRFRARYGMTPGEYQRGCRLEQAVQLLVRTDLAVSDVALQLGFCDQSHLTTALRRRIGVTPGRLRLLSEVRNVQETRGACR